MPRGYVNAQFQKISPLSRDCYIVLIRKNFYPHQAWVRGARPRFAPRKLHCAACAMAGFVRFLLFFVAPAGSLRCARGPTPFR